jgi:16S rRNA (uracil1498-N3)-methyltransferase
MARELRRLLIAPGRLEQLAADQAEPALALEAAERHYLRRVLRCRDGDRLAVVDGRGQLWSARLAADERLRLEQPLQQPLERQPPPQLRIGLAMAVPRRDPDLVWRMATELGVDELQPLLAGRSVVSAKLPLERWQTILEEAAEQCERLWLPVLAEPSAALPWLARGPEGVGLLATTRRGELPLATELLDGLLDGLLAGSEGPLDGGSAGERAALVTLAIGPEGGWTEEEERQALAAGWRAVSLAQPILRTATAAVAGVAQLTAWRQLSCRAGQRR